MQFTIMITLETHHPSVYCILFVYLSLFFCSYFVVLCFFMFCSCFVVILVLCIFIFVCTSVGLLPPGESPIAVSNNNTRWFKYDRDKLWLVYTQIIPVIFEPPCIISTLFALPHPSYPHQTTGTPSPWIPNKLLIYVLPTETYTSTTSCSKLLKYSNRTEHHLRT
jgi:hypothetical protein